MKRFFHSFVLKTLLFIGGLCSPLSAQTLPLRILPGDPGFSSSSVWPSPTMQWGPRFTYTTPVLSPGVYNILLTFQEIPGGAVTGPGQRVFSVQWLGQNSGPLDLWKRAGTAPVQIAAKAYLSFPGSIGISFVATVRNAVVSEIDIAKEEISGIVFVSSGADITSQPCPDGWTGGKLSDGSCIAIFFSQTQKSSGQTSPALVQ